VQTSEDTATEVDKMHDKGKGKKGGKDEKVYKGLSGSWRSGKGKGKQFWNYEPKGKGKKQNDEKRCFKCKTTVF